jgi:hypothetical protein
MASTAEAALARIIAAELARPAPAAARTLSDAIRERHGGVAAVLFYGSCLRKGTAEGVLDFYVLVDSYAEAHPARAVALAGRLLPPNVFYLECDGPPEAVASRIRCKYAVVSLRDFERLTSARALHPYIWARFAQPAQIIYARDTAAREWVERCALEAVVTCVRRLVVFLPVHAGIQRFSLAAFWRQALARTYGSELRSEQPEAIRAVYEAAPERFDAAAGSALEILEERGFLTRVVRHASAAEIEMPALQRWLGRWHWWLTRPLAKTLAAARLLKTAFTFGDWLPYAVWKIERHSGEAIALSERQRRHPLIFGWPVLVRLILSGRFR